MEAFGMSKPSNRELRNLATRLESFEDAVNFGIATGELRQDLAVKDENGSFPVVSALGEERYTRLQERVDAIGGKANVFVIIGHSVTSMTATMLGGTMDDTDVNVIHDSDMTVAQFVDRVGTSSRAVVVPMQSSEGDSSSMVISQVNTREAINAGIPV